MTLITCKREELLEFINKPKFCCQYLMKTTGLSIDIISAIDNDRRRDYFSQFIASDVIGDIESSKNHKYVESPEHVIRIRTTGSSEGSGYIIEDSRKPVSTTTHNIKQIKTTGIESSSSIDWIILNKILSDNWATFQFMGIKFDNSESIKKVVAMVGITIYGFKYLLNNFHI